MQRLIVIGGGIAGLSAAYYALRNIPDAHITVVESGSMWGGKIATETVAFEDGEFIIECGPDSFLATKPWGAALCAELGLDGRLQGTNPQTRKTYILNHGRLMPLPDGLSMMIPTRFWDVLGTGLISWSGKARMGMDLLLPPGPVNGDESVGAFVSRRLGREAYENLIEPLMSGIYAGDGDQLSLASTFPFLRDLETRFGSIIRGALAMRRGSNGTDLRGSRSAFLTPMAGLAEIIERLVGQLDSSGASLRLNARVVALAQSTRREWLVSLAAGEQLEAESVILATPAFVSGRLLAAIDSELAAALRSIPYASTATVSLAYREMDLARRLDGYGYVIPRREGREALACTWTSSKFANRAPQGHALLRVFIGRAGQSIVWTEAALLAAARDELKRTLGIQAEPLFHRVHVWENGMPQYNLGHPELLERIETLVARHAGLALAGHGYRGVGIPDCIHSGELAVASILDGVRPRDAGGMS